jgi:hypothetical protein
MFCMSEHEKREQIGLLAEEYSEAKGKLNHIQERMNRGQHAYSLLSNPATFNSLQVVDGVIRVAVPSNPRSQQPVEGLLGHHELVELLEERARLTSELKDLVS